MLSIHLAFSLEIAPDPQQTKLLCDFTIKTVVGWSRSMNFIDYAKSSSKDVTFQGCPKAQCWLMGVYRQTLKLSLTNGALQSTTSKSRIANFLNVFIGTYKGMEPFAKHWDLQGTEQPWQSRLKRLVSPSGFFCSSLNASASLLSGVRALTLKGYLPQYERIGFILFEAL